MKRLTPEEKEQRRKEKNKKLFASYRHTTDGIRGNREQWRNQAKAIAGDTSFTLLLILGLTSLPDKEGLEKDWKKKLREVHPDLGGSHEETVKVNNAYEELCKRVS